MIITGISGISTTPIELGVMEDGSEDYNFYNICTTDVGENLFSAKLINFGSDDLCVQSTFISTGSSNYSVSEGTCDAVGYDEDDVGGCSVLTAYLQIDEMNVTDEIPCETIEYINDTTDGYYSIEIKIYSLGGSTDDIYAAVESADGGNISNFVNLGNSMTTGGETYDFKLNVSDIGVASKLYLLNYGDDALLVRGCSIDGVEYSKVSTYSTLDYEDIDPRGCDVLVCNVISEEITSYTAIPCPNYDDLYSLNANESNNFVIDITTGDVTLAGSEDTFYAIFDGLEGGLSDPFSLGNSMTGQDESYTFEIETTTSIIGPDLKSLYLITYGSDALAVASCGVTVDNVTYSVSESTWDWLEYTGDSDEYGCGILKCDFINDEMSKSEQIPCDLVPYVAPILNNSDYSEYFAAVDTTYIPTGGTDDTIWLQFVNNNDDTNVLKSKYIEIASGDVSESGDLYTFRPNISNIIGDNDDITQIRFIQFGNDDFCIDYCQVGENNIIELDWYEYICNENDEDDNDACAVLTCDFETGEISSEVESPCSHDIYGIGNDTYRVYDIIINVCVDGDIVDTWSADPFFMVLYNEELDIYSGWYYIDSLGTDGENEFLFNTTSIGNVDILYLLHYNNDDVCISSIEIDGFSVGPTLYVLSEYDCEYSDEGCNVISANFETGEVDVDTQSKCQFDPPNLDVDEDTCWSDQIDQWIDDLLDFGTTIGIIFLIAVVVCTLGLVTTVAICCCRCRNGSSDRPEMKNVNTDTVTYHL